MHTDSSASRTCRLSRSGSLNTATVEILSSRQARITRSAISPRLATRTFRNIRPRTRPRPGGERPASSPGLRVAYLSLRHPVGLSRRRAGQARARLSERGPLGLPRRLLRVDRTPGAVRRARNALELEHELVGMVAVFERHLFGDELGLEHGQHRLVEGLRAVLGLPFGD